MKLCYNETMTDSNLENDLRLCEKYGYELIEIRLDYLRDYLKTRSLGELKDFFSTHRLKPTGFNAIEDVNFCGANQWSRVIGEFTFACQMAEELNAPNIVAVPTTGERMIRIPKELVLEDSVDALRELSDIAKPYGARIAFEPIGNRKWCVNGIRQAAEIIRAVDRDNVGLTIDSFNVFAFKGLTDLDDMDLIPKGKVFVYHINDAADKPLKELEPASDRLYPGDGVIDLAALNRKLECAGYDGMASLELFGPWLKDTDAETVIRVGGEKIRKLIG